MNKPIISPFAARLWEALCQAGYTVKVDDEGYIAEVSPHGEPPICLMDADGHFCIKNLSDLITGTEHRKAIGALYCTMRSATLNPFGHANLIQRGFDIYGNFWTADDCHQCAMNKDDELSPEELEHGMVHIRLDSPDPLGDLLAVLHHLGREIPDGMCRCPHTGSFVPVKPESAEETSAESPQ